MVVKSDWVAGKVLAKQARLRGDTPFMQFEDGPMHSYAEAHQLCNRTGNGYADAGVVFGENVALMLNNSLEYLAFDCDVRATPNYCLNASYLSHTFYMLVDPVGDASDAEREETAAGLAQRIFSDQIL